MTADHSEIVARLDSLAEDLADAAITCLRQSIAGDAAAAAEERRITRARRAVEKAAALLRDPEEA